MNQLETGLLMTRLGAMVNDLLPVVARIKECGRTDDAMVLTEIAMRLEAISRTAPNLKMLEAYAANYPDLIAPLSGLKEPSADPQATCRPTPLTLKSYDRDQDVYRAPNGEAILTPEEQEVEAAAAAAVAPPYVQRTVRSAFRTKNTQE